MTQWSQKGRLNKLALGCRFIPKLKPQLFMKEALLRARRFAQRFKWNWESLL